MITCGAQHPLRGHYRRHGRCSFRRHGSDRFLQRREADLLVSDPVRAYKEQAQSLSARLGALRDVEPQA